MSMERSTVTTETGIRRRIYLSRFADDPPLVTTSAIAYDRQIRCAYIVNNSTKSSLRSSVPLAKFQDWFNAVLPSKISPPLFGELLPTTESECVVKATVSLFKRKRNENDEGNDKSKKIKSFELNVLGWFYRLNDGCILNIVFKLLKREILWINSTITHTRISISPDSSIQSES